MPVIRENENRRTETANAVMTTLASPSLGGAGLPFWKVEMRPGQATPSHIIDVEQIWIVTDGAAIFEFAEETVPVQTRDTMVMPGGMVRRVVCVGETDFAAFVVSPPSPRAHLADGTEMGVPAWAA